MPPVNTVITCQSVGDHVTVQIAPNTPPRLLMRLAEALAQQAVRQHPALCKANHVVEAAVG